MDPVLYFGHEGIRVIIRNEKGQVIIIGLLEYVKY